MRFEYIINVKLPNDLDSYMKVVYVNYLIFDMIYIVRVFSM